MRKPRYRAENKRDEMNYGYFDDNARECIITDPKTPVKWINYIGTLAFGGFIDHTGGSLICNGNTSLNCIINFQNKYLPVDATTGRVDNLFTADGSVVYLAMPP